MLIVFMYASNRMSDKK